MFKDKKQAWETCPVDEDLADFRGDCKQKNGISSLLLRLHWDIQRIW